MLIKRNVNEHVDWKYRREKFDGASKQGCMHFVSNYINC